MVVAKVLGSEALAPLLLELACLLLFRSLIIRPFGVVCIVVVPFFLAPPPIIIFINYILVIVITEDALTCACVLVIAIVV
jgi:hypothetical protein